MLIFSFSRCFWIISVLNKARIFKHGCQQLCYYRDKKKFLVKYKKIWNVCCDWHFTLVTNSDDFRRISNTQRDISESFRNKCFINHFYLSSTTVPQGLTKAYVSFTGLSFWCNSHMVLFISSPLYIKHK